MLPPMGIEIREVADDEVDAYRDAVFDTFGTEAELDPGGADRLRALIPPARRWAAFEGARVVATAGTFDHEIAMPGGSLPMAGLTMVTVRPTHRRRGLMRQLMTRHLDDARERGFAIEGLWASEAGIYGRFGFAIATHSDVMTIEDAPSVMLRAPDSEIDAIEWIEEDHARVELPDIYDRATRARPGALRRSATWWHHRRFLETPWARGGATRQRRVLARRDGRPTGYLVYRQRGKFEASRPNGRLEIVELIGCDPRATLSLWQFALRVDLFPQVSWWNAPVDDPLAWAVTDMRRIVRRRTDALWLRIEDVPRALAARTYPVDGQLMMTLAIDGAAFDLEIEGGRATCRPSSRAPEVELDARALAATLLGGVTFSELAGAALVRGNAPVLARADRAFASPVAPWCPEVF